MPFFLFKNGRLYIRTKVRIVKRVRRIRVRSSMLKHTAAERKVLNEQARGIVTEGVEYFAALYGVQYGKIFIKNQQTRWGSCSSRGNLNFNYRIALLRPELQDYLIVHELCHLREMNHGKKFWDMVSEQIPDYKALDKELKQNPLKID
jgi:predicted metal-dependent hydrolase